MNEFDSLMSRSRRALASAAVLLGDGDPDGSLSRAYYGRFYATEALLLTKDLKFSSHSTVISFFGNQFVRTGVFDKEMGLWLRDAFDKRQVGDYSFSPEVSADEAKAVMEQAREFVRRVGEHLAKEGRLEPDAGAPGAR